MTPGEHPAGSGLHEGVRRAGPADIAAVAALWHGAAGEIVGHRGGPQWLVRNARPEPVEPSLAADLSDPDVAVLLGTLDDVVVGFALVRRVVARDGSAVAMVEELFVEPEAREVGVGEVVMDAVLEWSTASGCRSIEAWALPGMRHTKNFFERVGLVARAILVQRDLAADVDADADAGAEADGLAAGTSRPGQDALA